MELATKISIEHTALISTWKIYIGKYRSTELTVNNITGGVEQTNTLLEM